MIASPVRPASEFSSVLKQKVADYFRATHRHRAGNRPLYQKSLVLVVLAATSYGVLLFLPLSLWAMLAGAILLGLLLALLGFNIMHEGGHQSFSRHRWVNQLAAYTLNALGGCTYFWTVKHNINHHTFTNVNGVDSDINVEPFMRLHPQQPLHTAHRFQHVYWFFLYGISYIVWVFYEDFVKYFTRKIAVHMAPRPLPMREHLIFWITKLAYVGVFLVIPIIVLGWLPALIGYLIVAFVCGLFISIIFQLAHVVETTAFPESYTKEADWALHQVRTTSNFSTQSPVLFWLLGGLNFQVEHHLFPTTSHIHYPHINRLLRETCVECGVAYLEFPSLASAFRSHLQYLYKMGR